MVGFFFSFSLVASRTSVCVCFEMREERVSQVCCTNISIHWISIATERTQTNVDDDDDVVVEEQEQEKRNAKASKCPQKEGE